MNRRTFQNTGLQSLDPYTQQVLQQNQSQFHEVMRRRQLQWQAQQSSLQNLMQNQQNILNTLLLQHHQQYPPQTVRQRVQQPYEVNLRSITLKPLEYYSQQMSSVQYPPQYQMQIKQGAYPESEPSERLHAFKPPVRSIEVQTEEDKTEYEKYKRMGLANNVISGQDDGWGPQAQQEQGTQRQYGGKDWDPTLGGTNPQQQQVGSTKRLKSRPLAPGQTKEMRAKYNLKVFKNSAYFLAMYWSLRKRQINERRQQSLNFKGAESIKVLKNFLEYLKKNQGKVIIAFAGSKQDLFMTDKKKILEEDMNKRIENVKIQVRKLTATLVQNYKPQDISAESIEILGSMMHDYEFAPQNFLFLFEVNRFEYTTFGALKNCNEIRGSCLILTLVLIRIYIFRFILKPWQDFPEQVKKKEQLQTNCYIVASVMYEILMDYLKLKWLKVGGNQAHLPIQYKTIQRKQGPLFCDRFVLPEDPAELRDLQSLEEPLIQGLETRADLKKILEDDRAFCQEIEKYYEEWSRSFYTLVHVEYLKKQQKLRKQRYDKKVQFIQTIFIDKPEELQNALNLARQIYDQAQLKL